MARAEADNVLWDALLLVFMKGTCIYKGSSATTKTTPYPKGPGLTSPRVPSGAGVLVAVGCGLLAVGLLLLL